jgi:molecular chaperone GrpE
MPDPAPPDVAAGPVRDAQGTLTAEAVEAVLADFRAWLLAIPDTEPPVPSEPSEPIDLHTLLGQFIALRHEVNLQTKAARAQQEQSGATLEQLSAALEALRTSRAEAREAESQAQIELVRPLLKSLIDVYDALSLASREVERVQGSLVSSPDQIGASVPPGPEVAAEPARPPKKRFWAQWFGSSSSANELARAERERHKLEREQERRRYEEAIGHARQLFDSLLTGYRMSLQRIERVLEQQGLEPIACVGDSFDPEQMEAVAVVADSDRPAGEVIEEVRRGYRWRGRVFRYAQVSVSKP